MTNVLLLLILVSQVAIGFIVNGIARRLENINDFSKEDASVKAMTEESRKSAKEVEEAIEGLPPTRRKT